MKSYALHGTVHELLSSFSAKPSGSILITGNPGSGLSMSIKYIVHSIYGGKERPGEVIRLVGTGVSDVRAVTSQISRSRVNNQKPRLVIIDNAEELSIEAQNALLKSVEEPPANTNFVIACSDATKLLSTIKSRCFVVKLKRPSEADLRKVFSEYSDADFDSAYLMADGWPGTTRNILEANDSNVSKQVKLAKEFFASSREDKLAMAVKFSPEDIKFLIDGILRISSAGMRIAAENGKQDSVKRWQNISETIFKLEGQLHCGLNPKLAGLQVALKV